MSTLTAKQRIEKFFNSRKTGVTAYEIAESLNMPLRTVQNNLANMINVDYTGSTPLVYDANRRVDRVTGNLSGTYIRLELVDDVELVA